MKPIIVGVFLALSSTAPAFAWNDNDTREEVYGSRQQEIQRHDGFRGWRDNNGFLHGNSENPNYRGTVYCWANGVWICP